MRQLDEETNKQTNKERKAFVNIVLKEKRKKAEKEINGKYNVEYNHLSSSKSTFQASFLPPEHPSTAFSDRDKQTPTPVDDSPRAGLPHTDSGIGEEGHVAGSLNGSEMGLGLGLGLVGRETDRDRDLAGVGGGGGGGADLLCSLSDVRRSQESLLDSPHNPSSAPNSSQAPPSSITSISQTNKGINVKVGLCDRRPVPARWTETLNGCERISVCIQFAVFSDANACFSHVTKYGRSGNTLSFPEGNTACWLQTEITSSQLYLDTSNMLLERVWMINPESYVQL